MEDLGELYYCVCMCVCVCVCNFYVSLRGFSCGSNGKESACNSGDLGSIPGSGRCPGEWKGSGITTPVFLPGEFHGQRGLEGYSPWGCKESDMTNELSLYVSLKLFQN